MTETSVKKSVTLEPDMRVIVAHLEYCFGDLRQSLLYQHGRIEIGAKGEGRVWFYKLTELAEAAHRVAALSREGKKPTLHCGLIDPDHPKVKQYDESGFGTHVPGDAVLCWPFLWAEADHAHLKYDRSLKGRTAINHARLRAYGDAGRRLGLDFRRHSTGSYPTLRLQGVIRLDVPAKPDDALFWQVEKSAVAAMDCDTAATNSSQVLRIPGTIAWAPKDQKAGEEGLAPRRSEMTYVLTTSAPAPVNLEVVAAALKRAGAFSDKVKAPSAKANVDSIEALKKLVAANMPYGATPLDRETVREHVARICENMASGANIDRILERIAKTGVANKGVLALSRRDVFMRANKAIGGYLWTGAITPEEIANPGGELSMYDALEQSGYMQDHESDNGATKGIIQGMGTGALRPLLTIKTGASDAVFGPEYAVDDGDEDADTTKAAVLDARGHINTALLASRTDADADASINEALKLLKADAPANKQAIDLLEDAEGYICIGGDACMEQAIEKMEAAAALLTPKATAKSAARFQRVTVAAAIEAARSGRRKHLVDGLMSGVAMTLLYGQSNIGKTFVASDIACSIASGTPFAGREVTEGCVLYCTAEGAEDFALRIAAWMVHSGYTGGLENLEIIYDVPKLMTPKDVDSLVEEIRAMERERGQKVQLVVVDTLAYAAEGGDENSAKDMATVVINARKVINQAAVAMLLIHHTGKDENKGARGSSAINAAVDTALHAKAPTANWPALLKPTKQRSMRKGSPLAYRLEEVALEPDVNGEAMSSVAVTFLGEREERPAATGPKLSPGQAEFMKHLRAIVSTQAAKQKLAEESVQVSVKDVVAAINADRAGTGGPEIGVKSSYPRKVRDQLETLKLIRHMGTGLVALKDRTEAFVATDDYDDI